MDADDEDGQDGGEEGEREQTSEIYVNPQRDDTFSFRGDMKMGKVSLNIN